MYHQKCWKQKQLMPVMALKVLPLLEAAGYLQAHVHQPILQMRMFSAILTLSICLLYSIVSTCCHLSTAVSWVASCQSDQVQIPYKNNIQLLLVVQLTSMLQSQLSTSLIAVRYAVHLLYCITVRVSVFSLCCRYQVCFTFSYYALSDPDAILCQLLYQLMVIKIWCQYINQER